MLIEVFLEDNECCYPYLRIRKRKRNSPAIHTPGGPAQSGPLAFHTIRQLRRASGSA